MSKEENKITMLEDAGAEYSEIKESGDSEEKRKKGPWKSGILPTILISIGILLLVVGGILYGGYRLIKSKFEKKPVITSSYIMSKLEGASKLTSAELSYHGLIHFDDGGIPYLTQKKYSMIYSAKMKAGIDLSKVEVDVTDEKITVKLPKVEVEEPEVDEDSIDFYDESFALFNWEDKRDGIDAIKLAKKDCEEKADVPSLESKAYENAKELVKELLKDLTEDRELVVK